MLPPVFCPWTAPQYWLFSESVPRLVYYSHFLAIGVAMLAAIFVLWAGRKELPNRILFFTLFPFILWVFLDSIFWAANSSDVIMFVWSLQIIFEPLVYLGALYFFYVLLKKYDAPFWQKFLFILPYIPIAIAVSTRLILPGFDLATCLSVESALAIYSTYPLEIFYTIVLGILAFREYRASVEPKRKKEILLLAIGTIFFLLAFSWGNIVSSFTENWNFAQIGLFAMPVFIAFLAYSIVRFQTFNIKLLGAEALVIALVILTGSQFLFIQNSTNRILTGISFVLITFFGWFLVRGVAKEAEQKKKIEEMAEEVKRAYEVEKKAKEELQRIDEAKSQFIMATQHHLRTPLTALKGYLSMILEGDFGQISDTVKEKLGFCFESTARLIKLVNEFLDISKLQLGRDILDIKETSITEILRDIIVEVKPEADKKGIYLSLTLPPEPASLIMADATKLREALYNLIDNAVKYTEKGGVKVDLRFVVKGKKKCAEIVVTDTGIGMSKEEASDVFGRQFERGKEAKKVYALGRGIGLFITASIIKAHKGKIWADSPGSGQGSAFYVELVAKQ
ncbi:MAG: ATP-binding protein [Patescibacteria group bacterium]